MNFHLLQLLHLENAHTSFSVIHISIYLSVSMHMCASCWDVKFQIVFPYLSVTGNLLIVSCCVCVCTCFTMQLFERHYFLQKMLLVPRVHLPCNRLLYASRMTIVIQNRSPHQQSGVLFWPQGDDDNGQLLICQVQCNLRFCHCSVVLILKF